jgi:hypothetical protein
MELNQENFDIVVNTMLDFKERIAQLEGKQVPKKKGIRSPWTNEEISWLKTNAEEYTNKELSEMIQRSFGTPRSVDAIRLKGKSLGLWNSTKKTTTTNMPW